MQQRIGKLWLLLSVMLAGAVSACTTDETEAGPPRTAALEGYAELVSTNYQLAHDDAVALQAAIDDFVAAPSADGLQAAKDAWFAARVSYGQTEAFRFSGGPVDADDGPEGRLNSWPLDERYIDYVEGADMAGIINDSSIDITKERLSSLTAGGEGDVFGEAGAFDPDKAISTGYHAIEFLLWGQDLSDTGPGARPWEDYLTTAEATAPNGDRRGQFLAVAAALLVDDLTTLVDAWAPAGANFRASFVAGDPDQALRQIIAGIGILSKGELAGERMDVALDSLDQEDEHSCFSDNTDVDIAMNALGIENVYLGRFGDTDVVGIDELVAAADPAVDAEMKRLLSESRAAIAAIPRPFDRAIAENGSDGWKSVDAAVSALFDQGDYFVFVAKALGYPDISVELPE